MHAPDCLQLATATSCGHSTRICARMDVVAVASTRLRQPGMLSRHIMHRAAVAAGCNMQHAAATSDTLLARPCPYDYRAADTAQDDGHAALPGQLGSSSSSSSSTGAQGLWSWRGSQHAAEPRHPHQPQQTSFKIAIHQWAKWRCMQLQHPWHAWRCNACLCLVASALCMFNGSDPAPTRNCTSADVDNGAIGGDTTR
jgi:hypothetical protein